MKKKFNNLGFSLIEVIIAMGVAGMLSVVLMKLMDNSQKQINMIDFKLSVNEFYGELFLRFNGEACTKTLENYDFNPRNLSSSPLKFDNIISGSGRRIFKKGQIIDNQFSIVGFQLNGYTPEPDNDPDRKQSHTYIEQGYGNLDFIIKANKPVFGPDVISRSVRLRYAFEKLQNTYKKMVGCQTVSVRGSSSSFQETCTQAKGQLLNGNRCRFENPSVEMFKSERRILGNSTVYTSTSEKSVQVSSKNANAFCQRVFGDNIYALAYYETVEGGQNKEYAGTNQKDMSFRRYSVRSFSVDIPLLKMIVCAM